MTYADGTYYKTVYYGELIPDEKLERLLARASEKIDEVTFNRSRHFNELSEYEKEMLQKATCAEAEALEQYGELDADISSYTIGDVSVTMGNGSGNAKGLTSIKALTYLNRTNLTTLII